MSLFAHIEELSEKHQAIDRQIELETEPRPSSIA